MNNKTALVCPNCSQPFKVTKKCLDCGKYCCTSCTVGKVCIDCYTNSHHSNESNYYFNDKRVST